MNIWLVNPFDPLPGDPEQEGRYATLARMLKQQGHAVTWITSSFSHRFKKNVPQNEIKEACARLGIDPVFLDVPPYYKNVSLRRLWNHHRLSKSFTTYAEQQKIKPDVILSSDPPPTLANTVCKFAKTHGIKSIVDVQDLWPETFYRLAPKWAAGLIKLALSPIAKSAKEAYTLADCVIGVADAYVDHAVKLGGEKQLTATIPLGIDLESFDEAADNGKCDQFTKPDGDIWLAYTGSLSRSYDPITIIRATGQLATEFPNLKLWVSGRGELRPSAEKIVKENGYDNVTLLGFIDFDQWAYLISQCDMGFNASFPDAHIYLPNKIFYYLAAGCAVMNTIPGQCSRIVNQNDVGTDYEAGNVESCKSAIRTILDENTLRRIQQNSRRLAQDTYDRKILYQKYTSIISSI